MGLQRGREFGLLIESGELDVNYLVQETKSVQSREDLHVSVELEGDKLGPDEER